MPQPREPGRLPGDRLFFGRRKGRPLRVAMQALLDQRLAELAVPSEPAAAAPPECPITRHTHHGRLNCRRRTVMRLLNKGR